MIFKSILLAFVSVLKTLALTILVPILIIVLLILIPILISLIYNIIKYFKLLKIRKSKLSKEDIELIELAKKKELNSQKSFIHKLVIQFPKRFVIDTFTRDPFDFMEHGLHMFVGMQGMGKTIAVMDLITKWQKKYPKLKVYSNIKVKNSDGYIYHWEDLINNKNGKYGVVNFLDEIHTWFNSRESGNIDPMMLGEISQQRKQRKATIGTAQVFNKISKEIREQTYIAYVCYTMLGCITIVRRAYGKDWNAEEQKFKKYIGTPYFFVHDRKLRNMYDTYEIVERYKESGFKDKKDRLAYSDNY